MLADPAGGAAPKVVLMSSGSEVALILKAQQQLAEQGVPARVVSMPSMELFRHQSEEYQRSVLPRGIPRVAIEAAPSDVVVRMGWIRRRGAWLDAVWGKLAV